MDAKKELLDRLSALWMGGNLQPDPMRQLQTILQDYIITKEADAGRSNLNKRITYFLGAKRIDGLSAKTLEN